MAATTTTTTPFKLSAVLAGHRADVKAVVQAGPGRVVSASRDGTVKLWQEAAHGDEHGAPAWSEVASFAAHTGYVNSVAYLPPSALYPEGLILSGGQDRLIVAHAPSDPATPLLTLIGHTGNVCALTTTVDAVTGHPLLVSGSWDMTARVWDLATAQTVHVLQGHAMAVWAVAVLESGDVVTASADKTIRLWRDGQTVRTLSGHTDCIRALAEVPGLGFLSASNDATLRLWSGDGEALQELIGHTAYVYAVALLPSGEIVSSGEDRSLRVWQDGQCVETVLHPADSVWSVAALANGDVVTAANDGVVRIFTRSQTRIAPEPTLQTFDAAVAAHAIPAAAMDLDPSTVASSDALAQPGRKEGEVKMVRNGDIIEAHQWNAAAGQWDKVGVVTEVRPQSKQLLHGVEYDYVFDVDLEDGQPPRKLPYNLGENPFTAAQNFIHREELSQTFLDQVAQFITRNTQNATAARGGPGATAATARSGAPAAGYQIPGAYMSAEARAAAVPPAHVPPTSALPPSSLLPKRGAVALDSGNLAAIVKKLLELNEQQRAVDPGSALGEDDVLAIRLAAETVGATSRYHATTIFPGQLAALTRTLRWPAAVRFPGLDLLRLAILHPSVPDAYVAEPARLLDVIVQGSQLDNVDPANAAAEINRMMGVRALANLCCTNPGRKVALAVLPQLVPLVAALPTASTSKPYHLALSTLHLNLAVLLSDVPADAADVVEPLLHAAIQHLHGNGLGDDAAFRTLVAVGTVAFTDKAWRLLAIRRGALAAVRQWGAKSGDRLVTMATVEVAALLED